MASSGNGRAQRIRRRTLAVLGLLSGVLLFVGPAPAVPGVTDTITVDGDTGFATSDVVYKVGGAGGTTRDCADRGVDVPGLVTITYSGDSHYAPGTVLHLASTIVADTAHGPVGSLGAVSPNTLTIPDDWGTTTTTLTASFTTEVNSNSFDGVTTGVIVVAGLPHGFDIVTGCNNPTLTINQANGQSDPTGAQPVVFAVIASEPLFGLDASDIDLSASTAPGTLVASITPSGLVSVSGLTPGSGTVVASIPAGAATDADGNPTPASTSTDNTVTTDISGDTTTTITSDNPDPTVVGQTVDVQYNVSANAPGAGPPAGNVTVSDGTVSCTATVADGHCFLTFTTAGEKSMTATYAGDSNFKASTSASEPHTVNTRHTTTTVSLSPTTVVVDQGSTVTVTVTDDDANGTRSFPSGDVAVTSTVGGDTITSPCSLAPDAFAAIFLGITRSTCSVTVTPHAPGERTITGVVAATAVHSGSSGTADLTVSNSPPSATVVGGQCSTANLASGTISLSLADADGDPLTLSLASNSNPALLPNSSIVLGGSGSNRTLKVTGAARKTGSGTLTFNLSDGHVTVPVVVTVIVGTDKNEALNGTSGVDMIFGLNGANTINGNAGNDLLCGGNGNDTISGGDGNDVIDGAKGDDTLNGGNDNDTLRGSTGNDSLTGGAAADSFSGGPGTDTATDLNAGQGDTQDGTIP